MKRHPSPETNSHRQMARAHRKHTERVLLAVVFTAVELWAVVATVVRLDDDGVLGVAVSVVLSAALIAVWDTWQSIFATGRALRSPEPAETPAEDANPEAPSSEMKLVRL